MVVIPRDEMVVAFPSGLSACSVPCGAAPVVFRSKARSSNIFDPVLVPALLWQTFLVHDCV